MSLLVGLTGGMGSGKTLSASFFKDLGAFILDADLICRKLVEPGQAAWKEIEVVFGKEIFTGSGNLDRRKLADIPEPKARPSTKGKTRSTGRGTGSRKGTT